MADLKISALTASTTPLAGTEVLPIVQSSTTKKVSVADLTAGRVVSASGAAINATFKSWSVVNAMQVGTGASFGGGVGFADGFATCNSYYDGSNWRRISAAGASQIALTPSTGIRFNIAGTGTADSTMSWTEAGSFSELADFTVNNGNVVIGTSGKGINFTANTPAAGMTSQLLNWYEEGTWTPAQGAGLTLVGAFSSTGKYTRIGRSVTISGTVTGATNVAVTAAGVITNNLPFTAGTAGHGSATNAANTAFASVICTTTNVTSAGAIAATATITFSATYFV